MHDGHRSTWRIPIWQVHYIFVIGKIHADWPFNSDYRGRQTDVNGYFGKASMELPAKKQKTLACRRCRTRKQKVCAVISGNEFNDCKWRGLHSISAAKSGRARIAHKHIQVWDRTFVFGIRIPINWYTSTECISSEPIDRRYRFSAE